MRADVEADAGAAAARRSRDARGGGGQAGAARCGLPPEPPAVAPAERIAAPRHLRCGGLQAYHGSAPHLRDPERRRAAIAAAGEHARRTVEQLRRRGPDCPMVGGAGIFLHEKASGVPTEFQAGSQVFMEADQAGDGQPPPWRPALSALAIVRSAAPLHVVDAGHKAVPVDSGLPLVRGGERVRRGGASDEHGTLAVEEPSDRPRRCAWCPGVATGRWTASTAMPACVAGGWSACGSWRRAARWPEAQRDGGARVDAVGAGL